jgi:hypothetical protein
MKKDKMRAAGNETPENEDKAEKFFRKGVMMRRGATPGEANRMGNMKPGRLDSKGRDAEARAAQGKKNALKKAVADLKARSQAAPFDKADPYKRGGKAATTKYAKDMANRTFKQFKEQNKKK